MSKTIKSIICTQCHATEAEKLPDGNYKCAYCGCVFFVDDDTPNVNVNQNINLNINVKNVTNVTLRENESSSQAQSFSNKFKNAGRNALINITLLAIIITFFAIRSSRSKEHIDETQAGTLSQNLMGEKVLDTKLAICKGRPAFLTITEDTYGTAKHLKVIFAENFDTVSVKAPYSLDKTLPGYFLPNGGGWYALVGNNRIFHFDYNNLCFNDITDSIVGLDPNLQQSGFEHVNCTTIYDGLLFRFTASNGKEYYYYTVTSKIYDKESLATIKSEPTVTKDSVWFIVDADDYLQKIELKNGKRNFSQIKKLDIKKPTCVYSANQFLLLLYELNDIAFLQKIDIDGNEIWTKKSDYFKTNYERFQTDSLAIISIKRYDDYYHPERTKYPNLHNKTTDCYLYVRNHGDSLQYVLKHFKK